MVSSQYTRDLALLALFCCFVASFAQITNCGEDHKVKISEFDLHEDSKINHWQVFFVQDRENGNPIDNQIVFIMTTDGMVYRSPDEGNTWQNVTKENFEDHRIQEIKQNPNSDGHLWFKAKTTSSLNLVYYTNDGLKTFQAIRPDTVKVPAYGSGTSLCPSHAEVAYSLKRKSGLIEEFFYTDDAMATWKPLVNATSFQNSLSFKVLSWSNDETATTPIMYAQYVTPGATVNKWNNQLIRTTDYFKTINVIAEHVVAWRILKGNDKHRDHFVIEQLRSETESATDLKFSLDGGISWTTAWFPSEEDLSDPGLRYGIVQPQRTFEDGVIVQLLHKNPPQDGSQSYSDLFKSNDEDQQFTEIFDHLEDYHFNRWEGLENVYLANRFEVDYNTKYPAATDIVRTYHTFNDGSRWFNLPAPEKDANGITLNCNRPHCSLNLHGNRWLGTDYASLEFGYTYTVESAPGMMIATGNHGARLSTARTDANTYFTNDGGNSWTELKKGLWMPEIGDHGSIIVLATKEQDTNEILFTLDHGHTFKQCQFTALPIDVANIRVAKFFNSRKFILYGIRQGKSVIVKLDFTEALSTPCKQTDYEEWTPEFGGQDCTNGMHLTYTRRKPGVECYDGIKKPAITTVGGVCPCKDYDYECDTCYERQGAKKECTFVCLEESTQLEKLPEPSDAHACPTKTDFYYADVGYRLEEGNRCSDTMSGAEAMPKGRIPCSTRPDSPGSLIPDVIKNTHWGVWLFVLFILAVVIGIGVFVFFYMRNDGFKTWIHGLFKLSDSDHTYQPVEQEAATGLLDDDEGNVIITNDKPPADDTADISLDDDNDGEDSLI